MRKNLISKLLVLCMVCTLLPASVMVEAADTVSEQFTGITPGETYYFDLSGEVSNVRKVNTNLPDITLHYVPFVYAGTVNAYKLFNRPEELTTDSVTANENITDPDHPIGYRYDHSLFVGEYSIDKEVRWDQLNTAGLIFGKNFSDHYQLRSLSVGDASLTGRDLASELMEIIRKSSGLTPRWIRIWKDDSFWGQDVFIENARTHVTHDGGAYHYMVPLEWASRNFRPALEVLNPSILGSDGLKEVTLDLNGGNLNGNGSIKIVCAGATFSAPSGEGLTHSGYAFDKWKDSNSDTTYKAGDIVPNTVTSLIALWLQKEATPNVTFTATGDNRGILSGVSDKIKYKIDDGDWLGITTNDDLELLGLTACKITLVMKGSAPKVDSDPQVIEVTKAAMPTLTATQPSTIGGKGSIPMTEQHEYSSDNGSTWTSASSTTSLDPGTYLVRVKAAGTALTSNNQTITLNVFTGTKEATPNAIFTATGPDTGILSNLSAGMKYMLSNGFFWNDIDTNDDIIFSGYSAFTISVIKKGNGSTTIDSETQIITVTKAATPALTATQPSTIYGKGSIPMTADVHEYSSDNGITWTTATGTTTLNPGTYLVRVKAAGTMFASDHQSITLTAFTGTKEATPNATFTATGPDTGTLSGLTEGMQYVSTDGSIVYNVNSNDNLNLTGLTAGSILVMKKGNGSTTVDSDMQTITVTKASTPALTATQPSTIGGNGSIPMTEDVHEYSSDNGITWTTATGTTTLAPGTYLVRVKAAGTVLASGNQTITLNAFAGTKEATPNATFTATGPSDGILSGVADGMQYKYRLEGLGDSLWANIDSEEDIIFRDFPAFIISVRRKGDGITTIDSDEQTITVTKASIPTLTATQPSTVGGNGSIPMTADVHEYSSDNGITWTTASGTTTLAPGTYLVRVKAANTMMASDSQSITINTYTAPLAPGGGSSPAPAPAGPERPEGTVNITRQQTDDAPAVEINNDSEELKTSVLTPEEQELVAGGENAKIVLTVKDISATVSEEEKKLIQEALASENGASGNSGSDIPVLYVDLSLYKQIGSKEPERVTETKSKISITIEVPEDLRNTDVTRSRDFYVIRIHDGEVTRLNGVYDPTTHLFTFETDRFSTYALAFQDNIRVQTYNDFHHLQLKVEADKTSQTLSYKRIADVDGYLIYGGRCGKEMTLLAELPANTTSYTVLELKKGTHYKYQVKAFRIIDGEQVTIMTSKVVHSITDSKTYADPTKVTVNTTSVKLEVGKTEKLISQVVLPKNKKLKEHTTVLRYETSDKAIATVNSKGKITAKAKGSCYVYVYAQNGVYKRIKVTVE